MRKKVLSSFVAIMILIQMCFSTSLIAFATTPEFDLANFVPVREYIQGTFIDIEGNWAAERIKLSYTYGIINGVGDNKYNPSGLLRVTDALTIAARIHATYKYGRGGDAIISSHKSTNDNGAVAYCKAEKLIGNEFDNKLTSSITRAEMAHAWSKLLLDKDMQMQNTVIGLPDVDDTTPYFSDIIKLYSAGILSGVDAAGSYMPLKNITRAECAAIFMNLIQKENRGQGRTFKKNEFEATHVNGLTSFSGIRTVVNSKGVAVSISNSGVIAVCTQLSSATWKFITNEKDIILRDIIVVDDEFIAVGELDLTRTALVMRSTDGIHWTEKTVNNYRFFTICKVNGAYFLTGRNYRYEYCMLKTADFETLEKVIFPDTDLVMKYAPEILDPNHMMNDSAFFWPINMTFFNGRYVVSGFVPHTPWESEGLVITSVDLKTWEIGATADLVMSNLVQKGNTLITYGSNPESAYLSDSDVIGGGSGTKYPTSMYYTTDGKNYSRCNIDFATGAGGFSQITNCNGTFFGVGYKILGTSSDGINWNTNDMAVNWQFAGYANGQYCAVGTETNGQGDVVIAQSADGSIWKLTDYSGAFSQLGAYGEALFANGYFLSSMGTTISTDLVDWKGNLSAQYEPFIDSLFDGNQYVAISKQRVLSSTDGEKWKVRADFGSKKDFFSLPTNLENIEYSNGAYILYGLEWGQGWELYAWLSTDLVNWDARKISVSGFENANSSLNGALITVSGNQALLTHVDNSDNVIVAASSDYQNFTPVITIEGQGLALNKPTFIDGKWMFTVDHIYSNTVNDTLYVSDDLVNFERFILPTQSVSAITKYKDKYAIVSDRRKVIGTEYADSFETLLTKDFKSFENYKVPVMIPDPNLYMTRDLNGAFVLDDTFFVIGERIVYTKDFKNWSFMQGVPPNIYLSCATNGKTAIIGGVGIMVIIK